LQRQQLQEAVFAALLDGDCDDDKLHTRLQAQAWLPGGPLGQQQLDTLRDEVAPYARAFLQWRAGDAAPREFELAIDGVRLHGRLDACYPHGLARMRFGELHGPAQIRHGLDWLIASALNDARPLVQFAEIDRQFGPHPRPARVRDAAINALRALLALREQGLHTPL
ncbi:MAG: exodeoxyribonuclease V subunit gamma, partial [Pseudomonadota bacterium]|nr:exodeoxyribonuclease V subunit gamma [Pseudomonadota bacterium]